MYYERVIEIIMKLLINMKDNIAIDKKEIDRLSKLGYSDTEINVAVSWLYTKIQSGKRIFSESENTTNSKRIFHPAEKKVISPEARGFLIQLRELNLLTTSDLESLIEKIMMTGYQRFELNDIKSIAASYLMDDDEIHNSNRRIFLNPNDTVN